MDGVTVEDVAAASEALQTETLEVAAVDDALREAFVSPEDAELERELEALLDPVPAPAPLPDFPSVEGLRPPAPVASAAPVAPPPPEPASAPLPDFPSVPVDELSLEGLSLAEPPAPASPVAPARTPVPA